MEEVIFEVLGEGGGVKLVGRRQSGRDGWDYRRQVQEMSYAMYGTDDEEETQDDESSPAVKTPAKQPELVWVATWAEAMALMDRNPWAMLHPKMVHPEFKADVLVEATQRLMANPSPRTSQSLDRWLEVCRRT
jgi:hypothetical protein